MSYFWSTWNYRVFKPWMWLEQKKRKQLPRVVENLERSVEDKNRFYAHWTALEQVDANGVEGAVVVCGCEDSVVGQLASSHDPERRLYIIDQFEARKVTITRENCQGEVSTQEIAIGAVPEEEMRKLTGDAVLLRGKLSERVDEISESVAMVSIDSVEYDELEVVLPKMYGKLSPGGIMIVHDYNHNWESVKTAVDRFEAGIVENFLSIADMYGSVIMVKNAVRR